MLGRYTFSGHESVCTRSSSFQTKHNIWRLILGGVTAGEVSHESRPVLLLALRKCRFDCLHVGWYIARRNGERKGRRYVMLEKSF
jgi:hypothetical protein